MAYIEPLVMVYQEYASLSTSTETATLPACIIGPCYDVVDPVEDAATAYLGTYGREGLSAYLTSLHTAGAIIDESTIQVLFSSPRAQVSTISVTASADSVSTITLDTDALAAVKVGDYIEFAVDDTFQEGTWRVVSITGDKARLSNPLPLDNTGAVLSGLTGYVCRTVSDFTKKLADVTGMSYTAADDSLDVPSGIKVEVKVGTTTVDADVVYANIYVGFKALRQDLSEVGVVYSVDEIIAQCGKITKENPLAFGLSVALANSADTGIYYVGIDTDDLEGYTAAKDKIEHYSPLYSIVPLTFQKGVLAMFKQHAEAMSQAEIGQWRVAFGCTEFPKEIVLAEGNGTVKLMGEKLRRIEDLDGSFIEDGVDANDILEVWQTPAEGAEIVSYRLPIKEVTNTLIVLDAAKSLTGPTPTLVDGVTLATGVFAAGDLVNYRIIKKNVSKVDEAKAIAAVSKSYGSPRFVNVWPDVCVIDGEELPGYYLCCAIAGAVATLQPHYGFTRTSIAGIDAVKHSGDYFNREQLNMIADGGTFIFVQEAPTAVPSIRHQLTTDRSALEFQELSFVKNFDYVCYILKDVLDRFIGKWNITESTLAAVRTAITGVLENLRLESYPKIGSPVISYSVNEVRRSDVSRDRIEAFADVEFPYPLNTIAMHVISV